MPKFFSKLSNNFFNDSTQELKTNKFNIKKISYDKFMLTIKVPGYNKDELKITFNKGVLTVTGLKEDEDKYCNKNYLHKEFNIQSFKNSFSLSNRLEIVEANLCNGILYIILKDKYTNKDIISPLNN